MSIRQQTGYRGEIMLRRLIPLLLVFVVAAVPVALDVCQANCNEHHAGMVSADAHHHHGEEAVPDVHSHHAHHPALASTTSVSLPASTSAVGPLHTCRHDGELPAVVSGSTQVVAAPPAVLTALLVVSPPTSRRERFADASPVTESARITLTAQLRV